MDYLWRKQSCWYKVSNRSGVRKMLLYNAGILFHNRWGQEWGGNDTILLVSHGREQPKFVLVNTKAWNLKDPFIGLLLFQGSSSWNSKKINPTLVIFLCSKNLPGKQRSLKKKWSGNFYFPRILTFHQDPDLLIMIQSK